MKYEVVSSGSVNALARAVNSLIEEGWVPQGGICVVYAAVAMEYHQAMVKA